jgi:hypothetical protein
MVESHRHRAAHLPSQAVAPRRILSKAVKANRNFSQHVDRRRDNSVAGKLAQMEAIECE